MTSRNNRLKRFDEHVQSLCELIEETKNGTADFTSLIIKEQSSAGKPTIVKVEFEIALFNKKREPITEQDARPFKIPMCELDDKQGEI